MHKDNNKALESDIIANMAEDTVYEAVGQSSVENDDEHTTGEKIVATADENVVVCHGLSPVRSSDVHSLTR